jgi:uncharacterized membrane protein YkoI
MADRRTILLMLLLGLATVPAAPAWADKGEGSDGDGGKDDSGKDDSGKDDDKDDDDKDDDDDKEDDDDRIRSAVKNGQAESLKKILSTVRRKYAGEIVKIKLSGSGPNMVYRIRIISPENKLIEVKINAKTAKIVSVAGL